MSVVAERVPEWEVVHGDALGVLRTLRGDVVQTCVTSPPYFGLRDYGCEGQVGLEDSVEAYVERLVEIFREVRRVLRPDGVLWLNLGDRYAGSGSGARNAGRWPKQSRNDHVPTRKFRRGNPDKNGGNSNRDGVGALCGFVAGNLLGVPWRVAFALQADGWILRADVIWHKPNPMPESVTSRPTKAHEYVFMLTKQPRYHFDAKAIDEPAKCAGRVIDYTDNQKANSADKDLQRTLPKGRVIIVSDHRRRRSVWTIASQPFKGAHFACMPPKLVDLCVRATSTPGSLVLDPFCGSGTTGMVAVGLGRDFLGIDLNPTYCEMARGRIVV